MYDDIEVLFILEYILILLVRTQKDEFRCRLPGPTLHLNKRFDIEHLVHADDEVALGDVEALFDDVGGYEHVYLAVFELAQDFFELVV